MKRTPTIEVNEDFSYVCDVTKAWQTADGRRMIRGVASGVAEDRDGERVSARAIAKMAATPLAGGAVKLTSSHQQDWMTEIGDVVVLKHDAEHDELIYEATLPPEGEDPIADKAWRALTIEGKRLGTSIGGKLRKAYFELVDAAKGPDGSSKPRRRKVLDEIGLRHICLTQSPSYRGTFAEAVAKSFDPDQRFEDSDFTVDEDLSAELADAEAIAKAAPPAKDDEDAAPAPSADAAPDAEGDAPAAGTGDTAEQANGETTDAEDAQNLPEAKRHLACPSCGHEFAAPMPATDGGLDSPTTDTDGGETRKSKETTMDAIEKTLSAIRELAEQGVEKTETEPTGDVEKTEPETAAVEKTETPAVDADVLKMVAASHRHNGERMDAIEAGIASGFELVSKTLKGLVEQLNAQPQGRKSISRVIPPAAEVEKTAAETDDVAKTAETPLEALKALNAERGIR